MTPFCHDLGFGGSGENVSPPTTQGFAEVVRTNEKMYEVQVHYTLLM